MNVKARYSGIQSVLLACGKNGCLFLSLLSIAEEVTGKPLDLISIINTAFELRCISSNFYVKDSVLLLSVLTGKIWKRRIVKKLPEVIGEKEFTIAKYYNPGTGYFHFRRRGFDSLVNSVTVRDGFVKEYYIYSYE